MHQSIKGKFQSTLPIREETAVSTIANQILDISIHSSHTGRDAPAGYRWPGLIISIHSSHTGRDRGQLGLPRHGAYFNPLFPYGKRPDGGRAQGPGREISIHSSHTGRDGRLQVVKSDLGNFNPLFPYGKRPPRPAARREQPEFQSTLPIREETSASAAFLRRGAISIHSSHTGRDVQVAQKGGGRFLYFNPLFPYGKRRLGSGETPCKKLFQSTLPIREET